MPASWTAGDRSPRGCGAIFLLLADVVVMLHGVCIAYVLFGVLLARWRPITVWPHLELAWGVYVAAAHRECLLTPLEVALRVRAGQVGYRGGFVEHHVLPVLCPAGLKRAMMVAEALLVVAVNVALHCWVWRARRVAQPDRRG